MRLRPCKYNSNARNEATSVLIAIRNPNSFVSMCGAPIAERYCSALCAPIQASAQRTACGYRSLPIVAHARNPANSARNPALAIHASYALHSMLPSTKNVPQSSNPL